MLTLKNVCFSFNERKILSHLTLQLNKGEIVSLIGVSGSGKTTLFKLITGLLFPEEGTILIQNEPLPQGSHYATYMRQEDLLLPWRTVLENLCLFGELGEKKKINTLKENALIFLEKVGLKNAENLYPTQLSGGMRQRVSLARALLQNRPLLLLDEPFGSLDVIIREQLYTLLRDMCREYQKTLLFVTHDFRDALALSDRILVLSEGTISKEFILSKDSESSPLQTDLFLNEIRAALTPSC